MGIRDYQMLITLEALIRKAAKSQNEKAKAWARYATQALEQLRQDIPLILNEDKADWYATYLQTKPIDTLNELLASVPVELLVTD